MNLFQLFNLAYEALKERRLRASLTILMVVMGASLIIALNGTGNGFSSFVDKQFSTLGANVLIVQPRTTNFKLDKNVVDVLSRVSGVKELVPYIQQISTIISKGENQGTITVGVDQTKLPLLFPTINLDVGGYVASTDNIGILLGGEIVQASNPLGAFATLSQTVILNYQKYEQAKAAIVRRSFNVRGILNNIGSGLIPVDQMVFISLSAANSLFERENNYDGVYVVTDGAEVNRAVQKLIRNQYGGDINITSPQTIADTINNIKSGVFLFISIVAYVSLLVAAVGIITTLHTSMMERIREIGLLKALGFNNRLILSLFLNEAMIIGIVGGTIGIFFGMALAHLMSFFVGNSFRIGSVNTAIVPWFDPLNVFSTWLICVCLSMVAGFYPAWRASRLDPVVALRHE
ncbi:FtsX-like permease family protein [Candidatus Bathyarchaeota archaeon]|nr:FtsX-like permease family protein [Candidatus Bathyarchaeota archaeon]